MKRLIFVFSMILLGLWSHEASAFWGRIDSAAGNGLNVETGFDVNTITTLNGVVLSPPEVTGPRRHMLMSMTTTQGTVTVILGPSWYWEQQNTIIEKDQELTITGSRAQGKDGSSYLFAQRIENRSDGKTVVLRSETGVPCWSRAGSGNQRGNGGQNNECQPPGRATAAACEAEDSNGMPDHWGGIAAIETPPIVPSAEQLAMSYR